MTTTTDDKMFGVDAAPSSLAKSWALQYAKNIAMECDLLHMGWTREDVLSTFTNYADDWLDVEDVPKSESDGLRAWLSADLDERERISVDVMKLMAKGIYQVHHLRPHLTKSVRRFMGMMGGWWPRDIGGAPLSDHSMFGDGGSISCQCCGRGMGRHEEFRVVVYGMPTYEGQVYTRAPICWSCLKGGMTR